jgi:hypothetical protein
MSALSDEHLIDIEEGNPVKILESIARQHGNENLD